MIKLLGALALIAPLFTAVPVHAAILDFVAPAGLTEAQEVPPTGSAAVGTGTASFDTVTLLLSVSLDWSGLTGPAAAGHIHCCPGPGVNGPVAIDFVPAGFPNVASGSFDHSFDLTDAASYGGGFLASFGGDVDAARAAVITGLIAGDAYFNIHTPPPAGFPTGEIRGDIVPRPAQIPAAGPLVLLALGVATLLLRRFAA